MSVLTTRQRDILRLLLEANSPMAAADLAQHMHLTPRQVNYGLKGLKLWLAEQQIALKSTPGVGVGLDCSLAEVASLLQELQANRNLQLILKPQQRQQLLALFLLDAEEAYILQQLETVMEVSRTTVSADLDAIHGWLEGHGLLLERRPNYGIEVSGDEQQKRQALAAWAWGDTSLGRPLTDLSHVSGLTFALTEDTHLLPIVRRAESIFTHWDVIATIARYLLAAPRNERWPDDLAIDSAFKELIDQLMHHISASYQLPALEQDRMLRDAIVVHTVPAYLRQRFRLWMPAPLPGSSLSEQYAFEHQLAQELAQQVEEQLGAQLPEGDINNIALLLRAAYIRERPYRLGEVIVICPSGMASAQLLVAHLKARFPRLGGPRVLSVRRLTRSHVEAVDLVVTTIPLPPEYDDHDKILQVHPLLFPKDVEAITAWLSSR